MENRFFFRCSYSQEGEDMILARLFENVRAGFYVDVGACHPKRFSNTYFFYLRGWRGINIDASSGTAKLFNSCRPKDINLEAAVSDKKEILAYYIFNEPALNGFSKELSEYRNQKGNFKIIGEKKIETSTLKEIFSRLLPQGQLIDFLSVDVEGFDLQVLRSNDWNKYRPKKVLAEDCGKSLENIMNSEIYRFMKNINYNFIAKTANTLFFSDNEK